MWQMSDLTCSKAGETLDSTMSGQASDRARLPPKGHRGLVIEGGKEKSHHDQVPIVTHHTRWHRSCHLRQPEPSTGRECTGERTRESSGRCPDAPFTQIRRPDRPGVEGIRYRTATQGGHAGLMRTHLPLQRLTEMSWLHA